LGMVDILKWRTRRADEKYGLTSENLKVIKI
jgi:hypothetical protein